MSISFNPEQERDEAAEYRDQIKGWLENQMSRATGTGHRSGSVDEQMEMIRDFDKNPRVLKHLANIAAARGERTEIFQELSLAQAAMMDNAELQHRYPKSSDQIRVIKARSMGLLAQWPIFDKNDHRIRPEEYTGWLEGRNGWSEAA